MVCDVCGGPDPRWQLAVETAVSTMGEILVEQPASVTVLCEPCADSVRVGDPAVAVALARTWLPYGDAQDDIVGLTSIALETWRSARDSYESGVSFVPIS